MTGIVEVVDDLERQAVTVRQPFDQRARAIRDGADHRGVGLAMRLALNVGGEQLRVGNDPLGALEPRARGRNQPGRQRRRTGRHGVALDHHRIDAGLLGGECRA